MLNFVSKTTYVFKRFASRFSHLFSKKLFASFSIYLAALMLEHRRVSIQSVAAKNVVSSYHQLQYFLSDAKWDPEALNSQRVELLQSHRSTKSTKSGILALDDSGCRKYGKKTEAAKVQHFGTENRLANCNVVVATAYIDSTKRWPVNLRPYLPEDAFYKDENRNFIFKTKHQIGLELVDDALAKGISFSDLVFDAWYFSNDFIAQVEKRSLHWISEAQCDRSVCFHGKWVRVDELVKLIPSSKFQRKVTVLNSKGKQRTFHLYSFIGKVAGLKGKKLIVVAKGKWTDDDEKDVHVFVTNHLSYQAETVLIKFSLRWGIERIFQDIKDQLGFDQYQVRSITAIARHWHMSFLAYSFLLRATLNGSFSKITSKPPRTVGEALEVFRDINALESWEFLKNNPKALLRKSRVTAKRYVRKAS